MLRRLLRHPQYRRSIIFVSLLIVLGVVSAVLFRMENCYDPCFTFENIVMKIFGFWDPQPLPDWECKMPGVAKRICPLPQTSPYFYVAFDLFTLAILAYLWQGIAEMRGRHRRGERVAAPSW